MGINMEMDQDRNEALEFARRTRGNLTFIENAKAQGADVHAVTQLTLSLLGLIVFPKERLLLDETKKMTLNTMASKGWPTWTITRDDTKKGTSTLADIIYHLRNAVSHGRLVFTSDSPEIDDVAIIVEDKKGREDAEPYWRAQIGAHDLRTFCLHFLDFIDNTIG